MVRPSDCRHKARAASQGRLTGQAHRTAHAGGPASNEHMAIVAFVAIQSPSRQHFRNQVLSNSLTRPAN